MTSDDSNAWSSCLNNDDSSDFFDESTEATNIAATTSKKSQKRSKFDVQATSAALDAIEQTKAAGLIEKQKSKNKLPAVAKIDPMDLVLKNAAACDLGITCICYTKYCY